MNMRRPGRVRMRRNCRVPPGWLVVCTARRDPDCPLEGGSKREARVNEVVQGAPSASFWHALHSEGRYFVSI